MFRILNIALKDLMQLSRDFKTFMFLLIMPIIFTFLFGFAFGGFSSGSSDSRVPVGYLAEDDHWVTKSLHDLLDKSEVFRLRDGYGSVADLEKAVTDGDIAAAVIVPSGYGKAFLRNKLKPLIVITDTSSSTWTTIQADLLSIGSRLDSAVRTATIIDQVDAEEIPFNYAFKKSLAAWDEPPISIKETTSLALKKASNQSSALAHTAPGMMLQFAIAGLLTASQVIVSERKSRTFQRLLTTATQRMQIVMGHYLAIFTLIFSQFILLITFGQFVLNVEYLSDPVATLLVAFSAALCISAMGLLIGIFARTEEQAITFSLIPMFVFSGLGGAWVPLEVTGPTFQAIGHLSPVAWGMDGFENIAARGLGISSVWLPVMALLGYAVLFFVLAVWRLNASEES
jgi:ABC-2 type transport system permease protein